MKYRIVVETARSGETWYYIQKRYFFCFWLYVKRVRDMTMYSYRIKYNSLNVAMEHIQKDMALEYSKNQSKVVKREYIKIID